MWLSVSEYIISKDQIIYINHNVFTKIESIEGYKITKYFQSKVKHVQLLKLSTTIRKIRNYEVSPEGETIHYSRGRKRDEGWDLYVSATNRLSVLTLSREPIYWPCLAAISWIWAKEGIDISNMQQLRKGKCVKAVKKIDHSINKQTQSYLNIYANHTNGQLDVPVTGIG